MAFPLTHLCVAWRILEKKPLPERDAAQFLLGSIAPDAVHYRGEFQGALKNNIGATKKLSHLCPVSDERWGQVTDNDGWVECVKNFLRAHPNDFFAAGYAVHALTDIFNNLTIWNNFRTKHPEEAAKGYASDYYEELNHIDARLFFEFPATARIFALLEKAEARAMETLVTAEEVYAIQQNLLHEHFKNAATPPPREYFFVSFGDTLEFIENAACFCLEKSILKKSTGYRL